MSNVYKYKCTHTHINAQKWVQDVYQIINSIYLLYIEGHTEKAFKKVNVTFLIHIHVCACVFIMITFSFREKLQLLQSILKYIYRLIPVSGDKLIAFIALH